MCSEIIKKNQTIYSTFHRFLLQGNGGAKRDRTADPLRAKQVLSQLSYSPKSLNLYSGSADYHAPLCPPPGIQEENKKIADIQQDGNRFA